VADTVRTLRYQKDEEPGLVGRPRLTHPTELWALRWSDLIDRRREELAFLEKQVELSGDPRDLDYLRRTVGQFLPSDNQPESSVTTSATAASKASTEHEPESIPGA
jgi:hypothetical protein